MKTWWKYASKIMSLKYGTQRFYTKKPLHLIPYWEGDFAVIIPAGFLGKIRFLINPLKHIYIYVDKWKFADYSFDREIRESGHAIKSIIDVRDARFKNSFIMVYRKARASIASPEDEIVLFWWKKRYYKTPNLYFIGELE